MINLHFTILVIPVLMITIAGQPAPAQTLTWSDEFDGTSLNLNNWEYMIGGHGWGNNEWQYYTDREENCYVQDGYLHIVARQDWWDGHEYTSARIRTLNKADFLYGRLEARIALPSTTGIWPAFWMMPTDSAYGGWAASGEIDIMESTNIADRTHGTIHYGGGWPDNQHSGGEYSYAGADFTNFHIYTIEWEPDEIRWYVNYQHFHTETSATWYTDAAPDNPRAPFDQRFHFLLNVAVGGNWPGYPDETSVFPQEMIVDWVRVYDLGFPTVTIDAPVDGAQLPVGNVTIQASASDSDGAITGVEFYVNDILLDQDTTAPYSTTWSATDGCHRLRVIAVDNQGLTASDDVSVRVGTGCIGAPYLGYPVALPGVVELENYDLGGEGEAYHDCDSSNNGGAYRSSEGVDIEPTSGGGFNVGWMCAGEWLDFTIDVTQAGYYRVEAQVASLDTGGTFALEFNGADVTGDVIVPITGGWQTWTSVESTVQLVAGVQEMRFVNRSGFEEFNINVLIFTHFADHDYDFDGDVDLADWNTFLNCFSNPGSSESDGGCADDNFARSDADGDNDVDLVDFGAFQCAFGAP
jgi:beta-glucanase (GH16 family)